jgi:hypothetical protein
VTQHSNSRNNLTPLISGSSRLLPSHSAHQGIPPSMKNILPRRSSGEEGYASPPRFPQKHHLPLVSTSPTAPPPSHGGTTVIAGQDTTEVVVHMVQKRKMFVAKYFLLLPLFLYIGGIVFCMNIHAHIRH